MNQILALNRLEEEEEEVTPPLKKPERNNLFLKRQAQCQK